MRGRPGLARGEVVRGRARDYVDEIDPDVLVMFDTDHFHHWFYDRLPAFAVGVAVSTDGPGTDDWPGEARFDAIPVDEPLARHLYHSGIAASFDLALSEEFQVDHSITVPLHFLAASDGVVERPIVPVWINGIAPPLPLASRCRELGAMVARGGGGLPDCHKGRPRREWCDQRRHRWCALPPWPAIRAARRGVACRRRRLVAR